MTLGERWVTVTLIYFEADLHDGEGEEGEVGDGEDEDGREKELGEVVEEPPENKIMDEGSLTGTWSR